MITSKQLVDYHILLRAQVSKDILSLELGFEHLNVLACKMELEFIPIWFQLDRVRPKNEESLHVVIESLIRAEDVDLLVDDKGPEISWAVIDSIQLFDEEVAEASEEG